jgi:hypothetical protein
MPTDRIWRLMISDLLDGVRIPRGCQPNRRREGGEVGRHHPVQRLVVEDRRDFQARLGDEIPLDRVHALRDLVRQFVPEQADTGHVADPLSKQAIHLARHRAVSAEQGQRNDRGELHCLLFDRHLA